MAVITISIQIPNGQMPRVVEAFSAAFNKPGMTVPDMIEILRLGVAERIRGTVKAHGRDRQIEQAKRALREAESASYDVDISLA